LREQVIPQKVGNRTGIGKPRSGAGQRPAKRAPAESIGARLRSLVGYIPTALRIAAIAIVCLIGVVVYRAAASASFFQIKTVEAKGASRASLADIQATVRREVASTGVWRADLHELSQHLEQLPWVRTAIVTRVLPDGIRVRITERQPRAVVRTSTGRFMWVDEDAVYLGEMSPVDQMPSFFLRGWSEDNAAQAENRARVKKFLELQAAWESQGLSERVSELNLMDLRDVRVQLAGDDSQIEVRLGSEDQGTRLKKALNVLDAQRQTARGPLISYIDLTQGKRAIVGLVSGNKTVAEGTEPTQGAEPTRQTEPTR
jgi:cell division protein FtsQ